MDGFQVLVLHAWLMWVGMGLCMPLGLILIRFLRTVRQKGDTTLGAHIFRGHMLLQGLGLMSAIAGGALVLARFGTSGLAHPHGRLGVALLIAPFLTALLGIFRPNLGASWRRGLWFAAHWTLGTSTVVLAFIEIFIGMHIYELITSKSLFRLNVGFAVQIAVMAFVYLAQDRWAYMQQVQWSLPTTSGTPSPASKQGEAAAATTVAQAP